MDNDQKMRLLAYCTALTLKPELADTGLPPTAYDIALAQTGANVAEYWRPTKENYLSRITKEQLLEIGRELFGDQSAHRRVNEKKGQLAEALHKAFAASDATDKTKNWLPAGMAFGSAPQVNAEAEPKPAKAKKGKKAA